MSLTNPEFWSPFHGMVPLATLVCVAGRRWSVEESLPGRKSLAGLDEHQVRRWTSWHRWTILARLAHAFLAVMAATARADNSSPQGSSG